MKKIIVMSSILLSVFFLSGCGQRPESQIQATAPETTIPETNQPEIGNNQSATNATYIIDNQPITLENGVAESDLSAGSFSKTITRYFGNEAIGDLDGDGAADIAFLLTQETGGSGTFYYIAVALDSDKGYKGLNAILLGDRIAPQTTGISKGMIVVNYADRKADESFAVEPSVGVSKYFQVINDQLTEQAAIQKTGTLNIVGNEPFTNISLQTEDGTPYCLVGPLEKELSSNYQGKIVTVAGTLVSKFCWSPENKVINVTSIIPNIDKN